MSVTLLGLCLLIAGYGAFLLFDGYIQERRHGKTVVAVRLRRRVADSVFLLFIMLAGIYYELTAGKNLTELSLMILLSALMLWQGLRYPKWRLKPKGFIYGGRYWTYDAISAMRLSEDGILVLILTSGQQLILPVAHIEDLEHAAAFFTDADALQHLFQQI